MARRLIQSGLIEKVQSLEDKRIFHIVLTEKGAGIIKGDDALYRDLAREIEKRLSPDRLSEIDGLLGLFVEQIAKNQYEI